MKSPESITNALQHLKAELERERNQIQPILIGKLELPKLNGNVILRFNIDAFLEFEPSAIVPGTIRLLSRVELKNLDSFGRGLKMRFGDWVSLRILPEAICTLHYKSVSIKMMLDHEKQPPFYIDTKSLKVLKIKKKSGSRLGTDCNDPHESLRKEVTVYSNRACCCNNNHVEAYGRVSCDDDWRDGDCRRD